MSQNHKIATVFGGTGFLGTQIVRELANRGVRVKVATRYPERAYFLRPCGAVGQVVPFACDYSDDESLRAVIRGSDYVVNCIGILFERGKKAKFKKIHEELPGRIAKICSEEKTARLAHISALGADQGTSKYAKTKLAGEAQVAESFPAATILRPSVIFGEGDNFFNMFARMASVSPALPLIGGGKTKFQPVYVGDVADAVMAALELPALGEQSPQGKTYELGGPEVLTFKELYQLMFSYTKQSPCLVSLPYGMAKFKALFLGLMPKPLLTMDQVESLKSDNVVAEGAFGLTDLGLNPTSMEMILPHYLERYRPGGRFGETHLTA